MEDNDLFLGKTHGTIIRGHYISNGSDLKSMYLETEPKL